MVCTVFALLATAEGSGGGQDVETVHQRSDGGCPSDVECQSHIPAVAPAIALTALQVP